MKLPFNLSLKKKRAVFYRNAKRSKRLRKNKKLADNEKS